MVAEGLAEHNSLVHHNVVSKRGRLNNYGLGMARKSRDTRRDKSIRVILPRRGEDKGLRGARFLGWQKRG
jgi:hypothetical protein